jgi:hypothetical protein
MITKLLLSFMLLALCVAIHAMGIAFLFRRMGARSGLADTRFWLQTWLLSRIAGQLVLLHISEICLWALYYLVGQAMPDSASALYFSSVTYTTVGYGDLVLPERWRLVGGIEALTGILMCGWSTGFFFAVVGRMYQLRPLPAAGDERKI